MTGCNDISPSSLIKGAVFGKRSLIVIGKGKAIPLQALASPQVSKRLRLPDFKIIGT
jgi:hypothetical protein